MDWQPRSSPWTTSRRRTARSKARAATAAPAPTTNSTAKFLKKGKVEQAAQEAKRALESKEGADLKAAEAKGKAGDPKHWEKNPGRPK